MVPLWKKKFSPIQLFVGGVQGAWYDPTDFSTLFQDSSGTTPVTAVEQPIGLVMDKSKNGVGANGAARYNLLTHTESLAAWSKAAVTVTDDAITAPNGTSTADSVLETAATGEHYVTTPSATIASSTAYKATIYLKQNGARNATIISVVKPSGNDYVTIDLSNGAVLGSSVTPTVVAENNGWYKVSFTTNSATTAGYLLIYLLNGVSSSYAGDTSKGLYIWGADLRLASQASLAPTYQPITSSWLATVPGNHATQSTAAKRPVLSARYNQLLATETLATQNVTTVAADYTLAFSGAGSITLSGTKTGTYTAGTNTLTGVTAGTLTLTVSGSVTQADLRLANDGVGLQAYQRINAATDYDTGGFPLYLKFDGTDDALQTSIIDFTSTDKMTVFAGVRKLSDAGQGVITELSATIASNNGTFLLTAPNSAAANYNFSSKGTTRVDNTVTTYTSPISGILTGQGDISAPSNIIRVNGSQSGSSTSSQGTGNYGNYALNIGARNAASIYFNGRVYSLIVLGAATASAKIVQTETYINQRAKIY